MRKKYLLHHIQNLTSAYLFSDILVSIQCLIFFYQRRFPKSLPSFNALQMALGFSFTAQL